MHPEPNLGSSQIKILKDLKKLGSEYGEVPHDHLVRALDKLYNKGYVKFQTVNNKKLWAITKQGIAALDHKGVL
jgi:DNA-binding PadR family transcriptional regulator